MYSPVHSLKLHLYFTAMCNAAVVNSIDHYLLQRNAPQVKIMQYHSSSWCRDGNLSTATNCNANAVEYEQSFIHFRIIWRTHLSSAKVYQLHTKYIDSRNIYYIMVKHRIWKLCNKGIHITMCVKLHCQLTYTNCDLSHI